MSFNITTINNLPVSQDFISGDKTIVRKRDAKLYLIDFDNFYIKENQVRFRDSIAQDKNQVERLRVHASNRLLELESRTKNNTNGREVIVLDNITTEIIQSNTQSVNHEYIVTSDIPYAGPNNSLSFNKITINNTGGDLNIGCDATQFALGTGILSIPKGTYSIRASTTVSPESNVIPIRDLSSLTFSTYNELLDYLFNKIEDPIGRDFAADKQQIWSYLSFVQLSPSRRVILNGSGGTTFSIAGNSITLHLNGYFYTDGTNQYSLNLHVEGNLFNGIITPGSLSLNDTLDNLDNRLTISPVTDFFNRLRFNQAQFFIEKISNNDVLSPVENSPKELPIQPLKVLSKVPLIYKSGWAQKIITSTDSVPTSGQYVISILPFQIKDTYYLTTNGSLCYITDPDSSRGNLKIGDSVRFVNSDNTSPTLNRHDIRDIIFNVPSPGWYGLINDVTKSVGSQYNAVFKIDNNGVILDRSVIELSNTCLPNTSPPTSLTTTTSAGSAEEIEFFPIGSVLCYAGSVSPAGWLLCDGSEVSRGTYESLFLIVGTTYGDGDGITTFNLPDLRGRILAGFDSMNNSVGTGGGTAGRLNGSITQGVSGQILGATGGAQSHLIKSAEAGVGSHNHFTYANKVNNTTQTGGAARLNALGSPGSNTIGSTSSAGADASTAHNNVQPTIILQYIIKTR